MPRKKKWKCKRFSVHHKHYRTVGQEERQDFMILCYSCHNESHLILRYQNLCDMFKRMAEIVKEYFFYEGVDTFKPW